MQFRVIADLIDVKLKKKCQNLIYAMLYVVESQCDLFVMGIPVSGSCAIM